MSEMSSTAVRPRRRVIHAEEAAPTLSVAELRRRQLAEQKERFLEAHKVHLGVISYSAAAAGIPRRTLYSWMNNDPEFAARVKEVEDYQKDFVERKLLENINSNDTRAIIYYLSTKGRDRGYTTRVEVAGTLDAPPVQVHANVAVEARTEMSDDALTRGIKAAMQACPELFPPGSSQLLTGNAERVR